MSPVICIKREEEEDDISDSLLDTGRWEAAIITTILKAARLYKEAIFLDLGSQLGVFSVMVAALRHQEGDRREGRVVTVDTSRDNLAYTRKSILNNNISIRFI